MSGTIQSIKMYAAKGEKGTELAEGRLVENLGLEGDYHAKGGDRQLSLLFAEAWDELTARMAMGLCFSRFKENICIRGMTPDVLRPGVRFEIGETMLEITGETKHCHEECRLYREGTPCPLAGKSLFARVLKGGVIRVGDGVEFIEL